MAHAGTKMARCGSDARDDLQTALLAQKTALIGEVAKAVANEFNNTMMAVTSGVELELKKADLPQKRNLEQVLSNAARATSLIQKLLQLSRKHEASVQPLSLNSVITGIGGLLRSIIGENLDVAISLDSNVQSIRADYVELEQFVLGAAIHLGNTIGTNGTVNISTELVELDKNLIDKNSEPSPGKYAMLALNGLEAVGERHAPDAGQSTERKLEEKLVRAAGSEFAKNACGLIRISDSGTSFTVYFPAIDAGEIQDRSTPAKSSPSAKTLLIVEDDDSVRVPAAEFLKMEGFKVLQARTGAEAVHVALQNRSPLDLLVTDVVMPAMSGPEVADRLGEICPGLKILYISGDTNKVLPASLTDRLQSAVLQKPFRLNRLNDRIRDLIGK